jgi:acyl carrier protein
LSDVLPSSLRVEARMSLFGRKKPAATVTEAEPRPTARPEPRADAGSPDPSIVADLREVVVRLSEGRLSPEAVDPGAHLFECGYIDSFKSAELLTHIQRRYGVEVPEVQLSARFNNLTALARLIADRARK